MRDLWPPAWCRSLACGSLLATALFGCYDGSGELEPAPGQPGGLCLEPQKVCDEPFWTCEPVGGFCYDPGVPCQGVLCGGHGTCTEDPGSGLPKCTCEPGYSNLEYSLLCLPP